MDDRLGNICHISQNAVLSCGSCEPRGFCLDFIPPELCHNLKIGLLLGVDKPVDKALSLEIGDRLGYALHHSSHVLRAPIWTSIIEDHRLEFQNTW